MSNFKVGSVTTAPPPHDGTAVTGNYSFKDGEDTRQEGEKIFFKKREKRETQGGDWLVVWRHGFKRNGEESGWRTSSFHRPKMCLYVFLLVNEGVILFQRRKVIAWFKTWLLNYLEAVQRRSGCLHSTDHTPLTSISRTWNLLHPAGLHHSFLCFIHFFFQRTQVSRDGSSSCPLQAASSQISV